MKVAASLLLVALAAGVEIAPAAEEEARLANGEILARDVQGDRGGGAVHMQLLVRAPARAVWDVIVSCDLALHFVDGLERCEVLEDGGSRVLVRQVVSQGWPVPRHDFVFESLRRPYERIDFGLVEGNLKEMSGAWSFTERPDGTLVDYEARIRPAFPLPAFIVRRALGRGTPDLLACIRFLAAGSGEEAAGAADRARCPGPVPPPP